MNPDQNLQDIYNWLDSHVISRQKRNLTRDFSDGVPMAEILKFHFPKVVELHNYAQKNSVEKKLDNWTTLNRKVFRKIGVQVTQKELLDIAKSVPGAIENLLFRVKAKADEHDRKVMSLSSSSKENITGGKEKDEKTKMVPADLYEKQSFELNIKNEAIDTLKQKVTHLESMLEIKDKRISELQLKVNEYLEKEQSNLSFFNRLMK